MSSWTRPALTKREPAAVVPSISPLVRSSPVTSRTITMPAMAASNASPSHMMSSVMRGIHSSPSSGHTATDAHSSELFFWTGAEGKKNLRLRASRERLTHQRAQ